MNIELEKHPLSLWREFRIVAHDAIADATEQVAETAETNNKAFRVLQIGADLRVSALQGPSGAGAGETIAVTDTTENQGNSTAAASVTRFHLSTDFVLDPADTVLGERIVPSLAPGESATQATDLTIRSGATTGVYRIIAVADANQEIVETSETNNTRFHTVDVGSDLIVSALSGPATAGAGASIVVTDTTTNQGNGQAGASATHFYLSTNVTLDALDVELGSRPVPSLGSGASNPGASSLTIPGGTVAGNYYLIAQADGGQIVSETSETNNTRSWNVKIGRPHHVVPVRTIVDWSWCSDHGQ